MERPLTSPHEIRNPKDLSPPSGFSHAVIAQAGRTVYLAGQTAQRPDGSIAGGTMAEQFDLAATNVVLALEAAGAHPKDLVSMQIFVTQIDEYLRASKEIFSSTWGLMWACTAHGYLLTSDEFMHSNRIRTFYQY